jgi:hypothetical protein
MVRAGLCLITGSTERHPGRLFWVFPGPVDLALVGGGAAVDRVGSFCEWAIDILSRACGGDGGGGGGAGGLLRMGSFCEWAIDILSRARGGGGGGGGGGLLRMIEYVYVDTTLQFGNKPFRLEFPAWAIFSSHHHELSKFSVK